MELPDSIHLVLAPVTVEVLDDYKTELASLPYDLVRVSAFIAQEICARMILSQPKLAAALTLKEFAKQATDEAIKDFADTMMKPVVHLSKEGLPRNPIESTGETCRRCGSFMMVRTGTCKTCQDCGDTSGGCD